MLEDCAVTKAALPIRFAGSQLDETYHLSRFDGDTVIDIMRTHPMIIVGGVLRQNTFYVPPKEFLRELRARRITKTV